MSQRQPELSVVIPAYRAWATLPRVLDALGPQVAGGGEVAGRREVVVVESSGDGRAEEITARWPWARVLSRSERTPQGRARNLGATAARGHRIAFLDADAVPGPDWLDELEAALTPSVEMVAGAIVNGNPRSPVAAAAHILEFLEWVPPRPDPLEHAASCNLLVKRRALEAAGGFAEDVWTGEDTLISFAFAQRGHLGWAPRARVEHLNRSRLRPFLLDQYKHGVGFHEVCRRIEFPEGDVVRDRRFVCALRHRISGLRARLRRQRSERWRAVLLSPLLALGLTAWVAGLIAAPRHSFPKLPRPRWT